MFGQLDPSEWQDFFTHVGVPTGILVLFMTGVAVFLGKFVKSWFEGYVQDNAEKVNAILADARAREDRMATRIDTLENFQQTTLLEIVRETKAALVESTDVIKELHTSVITSNEEVRELIVKMIERPCLLPKDQQ